MNPLRSSGRIRRISASILASLHLTLLATAGESCVAEASPAFHADGVGSGVFASAVFDDGTGPALYLGGSQPGAGAEPHNGVSRWNGSAWEGVGGGVSGRLLDSVSTPPTVAALAVFDDGGGPALYAAGDFIQAGGVTVNGIARWDGSAWSALGSGLYKPSDSGPGDNDASGAALCVYDDGAGPALYVGGDFTRAGGVAAADLARWDGSSWSSVGGQVSDGEVLDGGVRSLAVHDVGATAVLVVGGRFVEFAGLTVNHVVTWNGAGYRGLGSGMASVMGGPVFVSALAVFEGGGGPELIAGGQFVMAGGVPASNVARWDGSAWAPLGQGVTTRADCDFDVVHALATVPEPAGDRLWVGGRLCAAGNTAVRDLARWDGSTWSAVDPELEAYGFGQTVRTIVAFDDGSGSAVWIGAESGRGIARRRVGGSDWDPVGLGGGLTQAAQELEVIENGPAAGVYVNVPRTRIDEADARYLVRYDGSSWAQVPGADLDLPQNVGSDPTLTRTILDILEFQGELVVAGQFEKIGGVVVNNIARWDGVSWRPLGAGVVNPLAGDPDTTAEVRRLQLLQEPGGAKLVVAGNFATAGGVPVSGAATWDGASWRPLPTLGTDGRRYGAPFVNFDARDGSGPRLYAVTGDPALPLLGAGTLGRLNAAGLFEPVLQTTVLGTPIFARIETLFESVEGVDGGEARLLLGGTFDAVGGVPTGGVAAWNGASVEALGAGLHISAPGAVGGVHGLVAGDPDGDGAQELIANGEFYDSGGDESVRFLASWNGTTWRGLGGPDIDGVVEETRVVPAADGVGDGVWVAGRFSRLVRESSWRVGLLSHCSIGTPFCLGDSGCPCGNDDPGGRAGCVNSTGSGSVLAATGSASVAADDLVLLATGLPRNNSGLYFMGDVTFDPLMVGDGLACTGGLFRFPPGAADAAGRFELDRLVAKAPAGQITPGDTRNFQAWTRDVLCGPPPSPCPSPCGMGSNLSSGLSVVFVP